jgi:collagenase-like PrtC family protease
MEEKVKNPLEFSVPYNNSPDLLLALCKLNEESRNNIKEIFLCAPQEYFGSGRITSLVNIDEFRATIKQIHDYGIQVNLVMNSTCDGSQWYSQDTIQATMKVIGEVHESLCVKAITIANPLYIAEVRKNFPNIEITASVLGDIDCVQRAVIYRDAGADIICPDVNINRNLNLLEKLKKATGARLKLLINEGCIYKCPFRKFHFNATSHVSKEIDECIPEVSFADFFGAGISVITKENSQLLKSCWIRPENLRLYGGITNYFKIAGRAQLNSFIIRSAQAYLDERWSGDMLDLVTGCSKRFSLAYGAYLDNERLGESGFFEKILTCDEDCTRCNYCEELARDLVKLGVMTQAKFQDTGRA